jgi:hypothetical protein
LLDAPIESAQPLCNVVLQIIDTSNDEWFSVRMVQLPDVTTQPLRIVYERAIPFTQGHYSNVTFLTLESNHSFRGIDRSNPFVEKQKEGITAHIIRILPISKQRPTFPGLPLAVLRQVAFYACHNSYTDKRGWLLSWALVCKAWLPLIDVFFECLNTQLGPMPNAATLARTLELNPAKAKLINTFRIWQFEGETIKHVGFDVRLFSQAHLTILTLATSLKTLDIDTIPTLLFGRVLQSLLALRGVKTFTVQGRFYGESSSPEECYLDMPNIQELVKRWPKLRRLEVAGWDNPENNTMIRCASGLILVRFLLIMVNQV